MSDTTTAYKVLSHADWAALNADTFCGTSTDLTDGFIHLSTASQLTETVNRHFPGATNLILVAVDLTVLADAVRWEPSRAGQLFPHVYAPLSRRAVLAWCSLERHSDGSIRLPTKP
jgi:uncharacterized protein (DUF952 family)